jgi:hypothetical protein
LEVEPVNPFEFSNTDFCTKILNKLNNLIDQVDNTVSIIEEINDEYCNYNDWWEKYDNYDSVLDEELELFDWS